MACRPCTAQGSSGKGSAPGSVNKALQKQVKLDEEEEEEETEGAAPVQESRNLYKILQKTKWKRLKTTNTKSKRSGSVFIVRSENFPQCLVNVQAPLPRGCCLDACLVFEDGNTLSLGFTLHGV